MFYHWLHYSLFSRQRQHKKLEIPTSTAMAVQLRKSGIHILTAMAPVRKKSAILFFTVVVAAPRKLEVHSLTVMVAARKKWEIPISIAMAARLKKLGILFFITIKNSLTFEWKIMLKIANWNLERVVPNQVRAKRIDAVMSEVAADIWVLTETHKDIVPVSFYSIMSEEQDPGSRPGERWSAILSRYPIESLGDFVSDKIRCVAGKLEHPQLGLIVIYVLVLPWGGSQWRGIPSRGGAAFASALAAYQSDWEQLQQAYPNTLHIVAGDFNQSLVDWHYYGSMQNRSKLELALEESNLQAITSGVSDPVARDSSPHACIDHICISKKAAVNIISTKRFPDADKPDKRLSDHFGVLIEFSC